MKGCIVILRDVNYDRSIERRAETLRHKADLHENSSFWTKSVHFLIAYKIISFHQSVPWNYSK